MTTQAGPDVLGNMCSYQLPYEGYEYEHLEN
jgi:hypothetical protein